MIINKLKSSLKNKKAQGIGINKMVGIILVILVVASVLIFIFRADISKWLGFIPDYGTSETKDRGTIGEDELIKGLCEVNSFCLVEGSECQCFNSDQEYETCNSGQYCIFGSGCRSLLGWKVIGSCMVSINSFKYPPICTAVITEQVSDYCTCPINYIHYKIAYSQNLPLAQKELEAMREKGELDEHSINFDICNPGDKCVFWRGGCSK